MRLYISWIACALLAPAAVHAQAPSPVDFARDVHPILRERCYSCHGPSQQLHGLRLDRRRVAMPNRVGANRASIVPGNSAASPLYLKLIRPYFDSDFPHGLAQFISTAATHWATMALAPAAR